MKTKAADVSAAGLSRLGRPAGERLFSFCYECFCEIIPLIFLRLWHSAGAGEIPPCRRQSVRGIRRLASSLMVYENNGQ